MLQEFNAEQIHIIKVFTKEKVPFYIPIYQRKYNWTPDNEVSQLIEDLNKFQIDSLTKDNITYYLGNIIVKPIVNELTDDVEEYILIDGQQRLTTILIFIKALMDILIKLNKENPIDKYDHYVKTMENILFLRTQDDNFESTTLKIHNPEADKVLYSLFTKENILKTTDNDLKESNYFKNYKEILNKLNITTFYEWESWMKTLRSVKLVRVELGKDDNEISVFESINSKGLPLNTLDLIRNYLFLVAENSNISDQEKARINQILTDKLEPLFTKKSNGEKDESKINRFFSAHIAKETIVDHKKEKFTLYKAYKEMVEPNLELKDFREVLDNLERDVEEYKDLIEMANTFSKNPISKNYSKSFLAESKLELYLPLFLIMKEKLYNEEIEEEEYNKILQVLDMHNAFLAIADRKNSDNRFLFKYIENEEGNVRLDSLIEYLTEKTNNKSRLITRQELNDGLKSTNIYEKNAKIARYILYRIENKQRESSDEFIDFKYSLEHIFPQNDKHWKECFDENNEDYKNKYIHTLGNLTLVKKKLNSTLSNQKWESKKLELKKSSLKINEELIENDKWFIKEQENDVEKRMQTLSNYINSIWPSELVDKVIINNNDVLDEDGYYHSILPNFSKITIADGLKIVMFKDDNESKDLEELKDGLIELFDYVTESEMDIDIKFSREKISTGGWMTERLHSNQVDKINKDKAGKPLFEKEGNKWKLGNIEFNLMENLMNK